MTLSTERPPASPTPPGGPRWWRRPWVAPLMVVAVAFVAFSLPPYLSLDPGQSRVPAPDFFPPHFVVLSLHVVFGSIAMITCCLQIWPWFRGRYPRAHRLLGRTYVFAGCLPGGLLGLVVGLATPFGPVAMASDVILALLWVGCTMAGWRMARQRRFVDHRRWMVRSFALTMSIITNRLWGMLYTIALTPQFETTFHGDQVLLANTTGSAAAWLGWTLPLLAAEWWLERGDAAKRRRRTTPR
ncbi:DUF2306 domain-containing protein [Nonomuraea sp. MG754425]|uniref:DUF2306 domain-containing protein n=1 Tax=Nonomuraea sp. MG754425 TaxID=2570319 RepID=UPI001F42E5E0|nr:DUF2306 domain-containing protein [Nonomuraea sp. MG754425]MCF6470886.1 DUF2306 domain-containing protein [Nonomuraea sp. MG754425]